MEGGYQVMSATIDNRVVEMRFDNKQFESNVQTTLGTLDKLKRSLRLEGAAKGLRDVDSAAKKCDMSVLSNAAETVRAKFSA
jgi:ribosomal protein L28